MINNSLKYTGYFAPAEKYDENKKNNLITTPIGEEQNAQPDVTSQPENSPLKYTGYYSPNKIDNGGLELTPPVDETRDNMRSGEGFWGGVGDVAAGTAGGLVRAGEMIYDTMEWFAPSGTDTERMANRMSAYIKDFRTKHEEYFGESKRSEKARTNSAINPRGWLYGGFESLGTMAPAAVVGGPAGVVLQFWGGTAQQAYDEAVNNERKGRGRKLSENEKIMYANLKGAWEGGLEAVQDFLPFDIASKALLPKTALGNVIRSAIEKPGNAMFNVAKEYLKMVIPEAAMEVTQEYLGAKTSYEYGQSEKDPGWNDVKGVIGPTIIMTAVLGAAAMRGEGKYRKRLHDSLTGENVHPDDRVAAVGAVYEIVKKEDPELAEMWKEWAAPAAKANKPVAIPLDKEVRSNKPPQVAIEKLDEALAIERQKNKEYQAQVQARLEGEADKETEKKPAIEQKETPNKEGVIEATLQEAPQSVDTLNTQINQLERTIENNPKHPEIEKFKQALTEKIQQRDEIADQSKLLPVGSPNRTDASNIGNIQPLEGKTNVEKTTEEISETGQKAKVGKTEEEKFVKPDRPVILTQEYIDEKYAPLLKENQNFTENLSDNFDSENITPQMIQNELEKSDNVELTKRSLRAQLADKVGDLVATSRYESVREGLAAEQQLDDMLKQVDDFQGAEVGPYTKAGLKQGIQPIKGENADVFAGVKKGTPIATTFDQHLENSLGRYKDKYNENPELLSRKKNLELGKWKAQVEQAAVNNRLPDNVLDDYVDKFGERQFVNTFRGTKEQDGYLTPDVRKGMEADRAKEAQHDAALATNLATIKEKAIADGTIYKKNGDPFATEKSANLALKAKRLTDTHKVVDVDGGFALVPVVKDSLTTDTATRIDQIKAEGNSLRTKRDAKSIARKKVLGEELAGLQAEGGAETSVGAVKPETADVNFDFGANKKSEPMPSEPMPQELSDGDLLISMKNDVENGEAGNRKKYGASKSQFPVWFQNKGLRKKDVLNIFNKVEAGKELTEKQQVVFDDLSEGARRYYEKAYGMGEYAGIKENVTKQLAETPEIKYSKKELGQPLVDHENIPDDMEVTTTVISNQTGQEVEAKINAKRAVKSLDNLLIKLGTLLDCVS